MNGGISHLSGVLKRAPVLILITVQRSLDGIRLALVFEKSCNFFFPNITDSYFYLVFCRGGFV